MMKCSLEATFALWDDDTGARIEVGDDRDGLDMLEIRQRESDGKVIAEVRLDAEHVPKLIEAIRRWHVFFQERKGGQ